MNEKLQNKYHADRKKITFFYLNTNEFNLKSTLRSALIIPYLNQKENLETILSNEIIKNNFPKIYVFQQSSTKKYNKGILCNIACKELSDKYERLIFHDVKFLPNLDLEKYYLYQDEGIIHLSNPENGSFSKQHDYFSGVISIKVNDFLQLNGYPNDCFGYNNEEKYFYQRVAKSNLKVYRPVEGKYTVLSNWADSSSISEEKEIATTTTSNETGINCLHYNIISIEDHSSYYKYKVNI